MGVANHATADRRDQTTSVLATDRHMMATSRHPGSREVTVIDGARGLRTGA